MPRLSHFAWLSVMAQSIPGSMPIGIGMLPGFVGAIACGLICSTTSWAEETRPPEELTVAVAQTSEVWKSATSRRIAAEEVLLNAQNQLRRTAKPLDPVHDQLGEIRRELDTSQKEIRELREKFAKSTVKDDELAGAPYPSEKEAALQRKVIELKQRQEPLQEQLQQAEPELKGLRQAVDQAREAFEVLTIEEEARRFDHRVAETRLTAWLQAEETRQAPRDEDLKNGRWGDGKLTFSRHIAPLLVKHCYACHNSRVAGGSLNLENWASLQRGGESGAVLIPSRPEESSLYTDCREGLMPKDQPSLSDHQLALLRHWIEQGASPGIGLHEQTSIVTLAGAASTNPAVNSTTVTRPVAITALAMQPTSGEIVTSGYGEVLAWDRAAQLSHRLPLPCERVLSLSFSPDGQTLAIASGKPGRWGAIGIAPWPLSSAGSPGQRTIAMTVDEATSVRFSPDGKWLATGGTDRAIRWYERQSLIEYRLSEDHSDWITALAWTPDSQRLLSASRDKTIKVASARTGNIELTFSSHTSSISDVVCLSEKQAASIAQEAQLLIWNIADGKVVQKVKLPAAPVRIAYRPPNSTAGIEECLALALRDQQIVLIGGDPEKRSITNRLKLPAMALSLAFDGTTGDLLAGDQQGRLVRFHATMLSKESQATDSKAKPIEWLNQPR
ncbi:c-type cytochrome domain-containing protein [Planctopirus hydrillae]|nr:c-type cytochrome domain-containing protein [Planctopirus hydrillae]